MRTILIFAALVAVSPVGAQEAQTPAPTPPAPAKTTATPKRGPVTQQEATDRVKEQVKGEVRYWSQQENPKVWEIEIQTPEGKIVTAHVNRKTGDVEKMVSSRLTVSQAEGLATKKFGGKARAGDTTFDSKRGVFYFYLRTPKGVRDVEVTDKTGKVKNVTVAGDVG